MENVLTLALVALLGLGGLGSLGSAFRDSIADGGHGAATASRGGAMAVAQQAGLLSGAQEVIRAGVNTAVHSAEDATVVARKTGEVVAHDGPGRFVTMDEVRKLAAELPESEWRSRLAPGVDPKTKWQELALVVVDFEGSQNNAHEIGFAEIDRGELLDSMTVRLSPDGDLPSRAVASRSLGDKAAETAAAPFADKLDRVMTFLEGRVPVAYNYAWDAKHLQNEWAKLAKVPKHVPAAAVPGVEWIDVLDWIRMLRHEPQNNSLSAAFRRITGEELVNAHNGEVDARATARVLWALRGEMPETYGDVIRHQIAFRKLRASRSEAVELLDEAAEGAAGVTASEAAVAEAALASLQESRVLPAAFNGRSHWAKGRMAAIDVRTFKEGGRASEVGVALFDKGNLTEARAFPISARDGRPVEVVMREVAEFLTATDGGADYYPVAYNADSHRARLMDTLQHARQGGAKLPDESLPALFGAGAFIDPLPWVREFLSSDAPATLEAVTARLGVDLANPMGALDRAIAAGRVALRLDELGAPKTLGSFLDGQHELRTARMERRRPAVSLGPKPAAGESVAAAEVIPKGLSRELDPAASWLEGDIVAIDFEATGANPQRDHIIEIGWAVIRKGKVIEKRSVLVDPGQKISDEVSELTGINDDMIKYGDPANGLAPGRPLEEVLPMLNLYWEGLQPVAHNVGYDRSLLHAERARLIRDGKITEPKKWAIALDPEADWIDTLRVVRRLMPKSEAMQDHRLGTLVENLGIKLESWHRAGDDAVAAGKILLTVGKRRMSKMSWEDLYAFQNMSPKEFNAKPLAEQRTILRGTRTAP